jgi:hypothetical protein
VDKVIPLSVVVIAAPANVYDTRIAAIVTLGNIIVDGPSHKMFKRNKTAVLIKDMFQEIEVRKLIEDIYYTFEIEENNQLQKLMMVIIIVIMLKEVGVVEKNQLLIQQVQKTFG